MYFVFFFFSFLKETISLMKEINKVKSSQTLKDLQLKKEDYNCKNRASIYTNGGH